MADAIFDSRYFTCYLAGLSIMRIFNLNTFPTEVPVPTEDLLAARWQYLVGISSPAGIAVTVLNLVTADLCFSDDHRY